MNFRLGSLSAVIAAVLAGTLSVGRRRAPARKDSVRRSPSTALARSRSSDRERLDLAAAKRARKAAKRLENRRGFHAVS